MENFYSKVIYDAMQLILLKQFNRAILLCKFLLDKGFRTNELIIVLSYAYKMIEGPQKALEVLKQFTSNKKSATEGQNQSLVKSPLIDLARTQYEIENKSFSEALKSLEEFQLLNDSSQEKDSNNLLSFLKSFKDNYNSFCQSPKEQNELMRTNNKKQKPQVSTSIVQSFRKQINEVTQSYTFVKQVSNEANKFDSSQNAIKYGEFYLEYDQIKQKILAILSNQLKEESQTIFKVKTGKKGQILNNSNKKMRKQNSQQHFLKQNKPIRGSLEKKKLNKTLDSDQIQNMNKIKQFEMSENHLEELRILLFQVNTFISFLKNRLKDYSVSRVQQISPTKIKEQQISAQK